MRKEVIILILISLALLFLNSCEISLSKPSDKDLEQVPDVSELNHDAQKENQAKNDKEEKVKQEKEKTKKCGKDILDDYPSIDQKTKDNLEYCKSQGTNQGSCYYKIIEEEFKKPNSNLRICTEINYKPEESGFSTLFYDCLIRFIDKLKSECFCENLERYPKSNLLKNPKVSSSFDDYYFTAYCYNELARTDLDAKWCYKIKDSKNEDIWDTKAKCLRIVGWKTLNKKICYDINEHEGYSSRRDECIMQIILETLDIDSCEDINDPASKEACYSTIAVRTLKEQYCDKVTSLKYRNQVCHTAIKAINEGNLSLCKETGFNQEYCEETIIKAQSTT